VNDEMRELQARLEKATARPGDGQDDLDAETAALREGWLALGQVLDSAEAGLEPSFEKRCREKTETGSLPRADSSTLPPDGSEPVSVSARLSRVRLLPLLIAAAAVVLVAVTIAWQLRDTRYSESGVPAPGEIAKTTRKPSVPKSQEPGVPAPKDKPAAVPSSEVEIAWDDPLDSEIASVGQAVMRVEQDWNTLADASTAVQYQLQQMADEFGDN
jgi:hypothetical protein